jgi:hypothetical protein
MSTSNPTQDNKALVLAGIRGVFIDRDPTVLDRLFSDDYKQHNPQIPNGTHARHQRPRGTAQVAAKDFPDVRKVLSGRARSRRRRWRR